jgi:PAS domain S-box-containing protein
MRLAGLSRDRLEPPERRDIEDRRAAVILVDLAGRVRLWNLAAAPMFGVAAGDATGRSFAELARRRLGPATDPILEAVRARTPIRVTTQDSALAIAVLPDEGGSLIVVRPADAPV